MRKSDGKSMVKTFIKKQSHSLDTTDVHTLLHISCFQQFLVSKLPSDSLVFLVFSVSLLVFLEKTKQRKKKQQTREDDDHLSSHNL